MQITLPWLRDSDAIQHTGEFKSVLGSINRLGRCAQDTSLLAMQVHGNVIG